MSTRAAATEATRERILDAALASFTAHPYEEVTIRGIAGDAGVALQTVSNHFSSKGELLTATLQRVATGIDEVRWEPEPGDIDAAIATLVDDYERNGDANIRMLAVEERVPEVQSFMQMGRAGHQAWVERMFPAALAGLRGKARARRIVQLVVVTDVYSWKLLRRDKGLDKDQTTIAMCELVAALHQNA